jgi:hypothetical protein
MKTSSYHGREVEEVFIKLLLLLDIVVVRYEMDVLYFKCACERDT